MQFGWTGSKWILRKQLVFVVLNFVLAVNKRTLTMQSFVMISLAVVVIAFVEHPSIRDSSNLTGNFHTPVGLQFGFAFVKIVVNSCYAVVPELVPATDAEQLKCILISWLLDGTKNGTHILVKTVWF